ncbi:unnamed protein product, partial [Polarella glacialis]
DLGPELDQAPDLLASQHTSLPSGPGQPGAFGQNEGYAATVSPCASLGFSGASLQTPMSTAAVTPRSPVASASNSFDLMTGIPARADVSTPGPARDSQERFGFVSDMIFKAADTQQ